MHWQNRCIFFCKKSVYAPTERIFSYLCTEAMKNLRTLRIILSLFFIVASAAYFTIGRDSSRFGSLAFSAQIVPSAAGVAIGATSFWIVMTFLFGRVYCSSVCPVGTLLDGIAALRKFMPAKFKEYSFRKTSHWRFYTLAIYIMCLFAGVTIVPMLIEPWHIFGNIVTVFRPSATESQWIHLGVNSLTGVIAGAVSLLLLAATGLFTGRGFCNNICPIGTALNIAGSRALYQMEIDPDRCTSCMECEYVCKSECIKVISRYVDDSRCVRCFNCIRVCRDDAIRLQINRNRPATPLMRKMNRSTGKS